jgi:hypothetical protein
MPGPKLVTPSNEEYFSPELVITQTSRPPIGTGASLVMETFVIMTSSSSSLMSILMVRISACNEPLFPEVGTLMSLA